MIQNKNLNLFYILLIVLFSSCGSSKKMARQFEELPVWVKKKPHSELTYYGVGKALKNGFPDLYIKAAEKQALTDLAEHISVKVNTTSLLYQFDIDNQQSDFYMNKQNIKSTNFFEGYTISKTYENEDYYWNLIEITKAKYEEIKRQRKTTTLKKAYQYYLEGQLKKGTHELYNATSFFIKSLETLKPYWNENTIFKTQAGELIDLSNENINEVHILFNGLSIQNRKNTITLKRGEILNTKTPIATLTHVKYGLLDNFPYTITSSITLEKSKQLYTKSGGLISSIPLLAATQNSKESIEIIVNGQEIIQSLTTDLLLRKILINTSPKPLKSNVYIEIVQPLIKVAISSKNKGLNLDQTKLQTINYFEKKGVFSPMKSATIYYKIYIEIVEISKESFNIRTKLLSPKEQTIFTKNRVITIDPFVYPTKEKRIQSILNSLKRKELSRALEIIQ